MKKYFLIPLLFLCALQAAAQGVNFITITDEAQYRESGDFTNTFEMRVKESATGNISKCQAVRIDKNWYLTAAHCVVPACDKACDIQVRLAVTPGYEMAANITHNAKKQAVFKNSKVKTEQGRASYDIALLNIPAKTAQYTFRIPARNLQITEEMFLKLIPDFNVYYKAVNGTNLPDIMHVSGGYPAEIKRQAAVVSIWDGMRSVLPTDKPLFYMPAQNYIFTENFGIIQGISGSGVMTNTGELIGIVSAIATLEAQDKKQNKKRSTPIVFIVPFDDFITNFIKETTGITNIKKAGKSVLSPIKLEEAFIPNAIEKVIS